MGRRLLVASIMWLAAACTSTTTNDVGGDTNWRLNRDKWQALGITSYDLTIRSECFCGAPSDPVVVVVRNGEVQSRTVKATGAPVDAAYAKWFPTVPGLFSVVLDAIDRKASYLGVEYDKTYGNPATIQIDFSGGSVGDKFNYYVESLTPRQ